MKQKFGFPPAIVVLLVFLMVVCALMGAYVLRKSTIDALIFVPFSLASLGLLLLLRTFYVIVGEQGLTIKTVGKKEFNLRDVQYWQQQKDGVQIRLAQRNLHIPIASQTERQAFVSHLEQHPVLATKQQN